MTPEQYKERAAILGIRDHMEKPMAPFDPSVGFYKESNYLPGGEKRSMKVKVPLADMSHLNPSTWHRHQRLGRMKKTRRAK